MNPQKADMNEIDKLRDQLATAALRADIHAHEQINKQLIEDKRRLDWLERKSPWERWIDPDGPDITLRKPIRECIDAARKEVQP